MGTPENPCHFRENPLKLLNLNIISVIINYYSPKFLPRNRIWVFFKPNRSAGVLNSRPTGVFDHKKTI